MAKRARSTKRTRGRASVRTGVGEVALPALDTLADMPTWGDVVPDDAQVEAFERFQAGAPENGEELHLGCVVRLDRGFPAVLFECGVVRAEHAVSFAKEAGEKPAVGDWVALRAPEAHDKGLIEAVLPRRSDIARWRGGARGDRQTLAANVDVVLVAQPLGERGLSLDRLARSAVIARDSGCDVAVVLTKADRVAPRDVAAAVGSVRLVLGDVPVAVLGGLGKGDDAGDQARAAEQVGAGFGPEAVAALVPERTVAMVLGESGVGKSTLLNAMLGHDALETGAVRGRDDAGRHTTVTRRMVKLPGRGVVIDCPGLRSLPLVGHERGLARVFPRIVEAAQGCRYNDCTHEHEPGCAVAEAQAEGRFSTEALDAYRALAREMRDSAETLDPDVRL